MTSKIRIHTRPKFRQTTSKLDKMGSKNGTWLMFMKGTMGPLRKSPQSFQGGRGVGGVGNISLHCIPWRTSHPIFLTGGCGFSVWLLIYNIFLAPSVKIANPMRGDTRRHDEAPLFIKNLPDFHALYREVVKPNDPERHPDTSCCTSLLGDSPVAWILTIAQRYVVDLLWSLPYISHRLLDRVV